MGALTGENVSGGAIARSAAADDWPAAVALTGVSRSVLATYLNNFI